MAQICSFFIQSFLFSKKNLSRWNSNSMRILAETLSPEILMQYCYLLQEPKLLMPCLNMTAMWILVIGRIPLRIEFSVFHWHTHIYLVSSCSPGVLLRTTGHSRGQATVLWCCIVERDECFLPVHKTTQKGHVTFLILENKHLDLPANTKKDKAASLVGKDVQEETCREFTFFFSFFFFFKWALNIKHIFDILGH